MRRRRGFSPALALLLALVLVVAAVAVLERNLRPAVMAVAQAEARIRAVQAINRAVLDHATTPRYTDLYEMQSNAQGYVTFMQPNTPIFNQVAGEVTLAVQRELAEISGEDFRVPLGQALGSHIFAAFGPQIRVRALTLGPVEIQLDSRFEQAGINQTRHIVQLHVTADMQIVAPFERRTIPVGQTIEVAEGIIVGDVPETVIDFQWPLATPAPSGGAPPGGPPSGAAR